MVQILRLACEKGLSSVLKPLILISVLLASPIVMSATKHILIVGDSLSAEYGLARGTGWAALLEKKLAEQKIEAKLTNASISGETTSGGAARIDKLIATHKPTHVIVELGGNDALRGLPLAKTEANLTRIVKAAQATHAKVLILGMQIPPNYGGDYQAKFAGVFEKVAKDEKVLLVPFFLTGVGDVPNATELFQRDRIHPNEKAQVRMMENVWVKFAPMLK
jgi:acyl-CoA thioesterase I